MHRVGRGNLGIVKIKWNYGKLEFSRFLTSTIIMSNNNGITYEMFLAPGNCDVHVKTQIFVLQKLSKHVFETLFSIKKFACRGPLWEW